MSDEFLIASMCRGKEAFTTPQIAREVERKRRRRGIKVETYRCLVCQQWHLGNHSPSMTDKKRQPKPKPPRVRSLRELEAWDGDVTFGDAE